MTTYDAIQEILKAQKEMYSAFVAFGTRLVAIEAKLAPQPTHTEPEPSSIWTPPEIDDPLAEYEQTDAGWISKEYRFTEFPGDFQFLEACWVGVEPPTGRVMHAGNLAEMKTRRSVALTFHALDLRGNWGDTDWAKANIGPNPAACLVLLGMARMPASNVLDSGSQFGPGTWNNITDLQTLFLKLKSLSEGTGGPSGGQ